MQIINQETVLAPLDEVRPHPDNPHEGDLGALHESIEHNGFYGSIVVQRSSGYILAGNHRYLAARQAGAPALPVTYVDVDDQTARRILLADNRITKLGSENTEMIAALLKQIEAEEGSLEGTGYDAEALEEMLADLAQMLLADTALPSSKEYDETAADDLPTEMCEQCGRLCLRDKKSPKSTH